MAEELLTVAEAARSLKVNPQTVRRWIKAGLLPASRIGRRQWRIRERDLEGQAERGPEKLARRRAAVKAIRDWREQLRRRGVRVDVVELVRESRRELEARGGSGGC